MNDQLKEKIEREATLYSTANNGFFGESMKITDYQKHKIFKDGANWLWDEGYRFTEQDIVGFILFAENPENYGLTTPEMLSKWLKERE